MTPRALTYAEVLDHLGYSRRTRIDGVSPIDPPVPSNDERTLSLHSTGALDTERMFDAESIRRSSGTH